MNCPACHDLRYGEASLLVHLNNDHEWDFLTIARKLGPLREAP